jgi:flagellar hook-basal body complex protein FliE
LQYARHIAEEAQRKLREAIEDAERVATSLADKVADTAKGVQHDLEKLTPNFDEKLKQIMDEVTEVASAAAEDGVDITEAINSAVEIALKKVEEALKAVIDAVNRFLWQAQETLFGFLKGVLPDWLQWVLDKVKQAVQWALRGLQSFADKLKEGISIILEKIKSAIQVFVKRVGEVLGPIWKFVKALWKLLFGTEPEHCQMVAEWFEERMKRTENQLL